MRILTFACSTVLFLPFLSSNAWANPAIKAQHSTNFSESQIDKTSNSDLTLTADNSGSDSWSDSESDELENAQFKLQDIQQRNFTPSRGAPGLTIANPYGFGVDRGFYSGLSYQVDTRGGDEGTNDGDATMVFGLGLGDAQKLVGAELSYTLASFGNNRDFGSGGFNLKLHRRIAEGWGVSAGWNSFLSTGDNNDLEDSLYLSTTKIFKMREDINSPFSRVGATIGIGNGQFRSVDNIANDNGNVNVFGSLAFRVARPVSFVTEWTGQDLAMGLSVSPLRTVPLSIHLGARDIVGAGDGARFIFGLGAGF
ncbi:MAG: hypothetical protein ACFCU7_18245 [Pleurocapsa sp.]